MEDSSLLLHEMEDSSLLDLNNDAAHFIKGGDYKDAIHLLNRAVKISMKRLGGKQDAGFSFSTAEAVEEVPQTKPRKHRHRRSEESRAPSHHRHSRRAKKRTAAASPCEEEAPSSPNADVDFHGLEVSAPARTAAASPCEEEAPSSPNADVDFHEFSTNLFS
jgi:hypothetical protein